METLEDLAVAILRTRGVQCNIWKEELKGKVMAAVYAYADACAAEPLSGEGIAQRERDLRSTLSVVFALIPEDRDGQTT